MSTYAVIENGVVINVIVLDETDGWTPPEGCISVASEVAGIGWTYANGVFSPPEPEVPVPDLNMLAAIARDKRDRLLVDVCDRGVSIVQRGIRMAGGDPVQLAYLDGKLSELDIYAVALQEIPDQPGFPQSIIWPSEPTK